MNDRLHEALRYLKKGWSIFPVSAPDREPMLKWKEFQTRQPSVAEVQAWWRRWPNAGIAIVTGRVSGLVVVDIDPRKGGNVEGLPPTDLTSWTGGGGMHYFYAYPENFEGSVPQQANGPAHPDEQRRGKDVRGDGGYVVAPPSIHPSGKVYRWVEEGKPGKPPTWALHAYRADRTQTDESVKWISDLIENGAREGERNQSLTKLAGYFAGLTRPMPLDVAQSFCRVWMRQLPPDRQLGDKEIEQTVKSVYTTAYRNNPELRKQASTQRGKFDVMSLTQFMEEYGGREIIWDVDGFLPQSTIAFVAASPGSYKTWLTLDLAASIATGQPFLDRFQCRHRGTVIIAQQEDFTGQTADRIAVILRNKLKRAVISVNDDDTIAMGAPVRDDEASLHFHVDRKLNFYDDEAMGGLEKVIQRMRPRLVLIDPFYSTVEMKDYMVEAVTKLDVLKQWRDQYGTSFMLVHHTTKDTGTWDRTALWGSQFLNAFGESIWHIRRPDATEAYTLLARHFKMAGPQEYLRIEFDINTKPMFENYSTHTEEITKEEAEQAIAQKPQDGKASDIVNNVLNYVRKAQGVTIAEISTMCKIDPTETMKIVRRLKKTNKIEENAAGLLVYSFVDLE